MFSFFKRKPKLSLIRQEDQIWSDRASKYGGIIKGIDTNDISAPVLIIYFFDYSGEEASFILEKSEAESLNNYSIGFFKVDNVAKNITLIKDNDLSSLSSYSKSYPNADIIIVEHYPVFSREELLLSQLDKYLPGSKVTFYSDFKEPVFEIFQMDRIEQLLKKMGLESNESISHAMVSKSIERAQKKIEEKIVSDTECRSQKEWIERYNNQIN